MTDLATAPTPVINITTPPLAEAARRDIHEFGQAREQLMPIGGQGVPAVSGQTLPNTDPATEQPLARVPRGGAADVDAAVQAAKRAFADSSWADMTPARARSAAGRTFGSAATRSGAAAVPAGAAVLGIDHHELARDQGRPAVDRSTGRRARVLLTAAGVAGVGHAVGLSWPVAFVLGAVLAPTDATAVAAVAGWLPRRTLTTLRAESLINDGTALVVYALAVEAATGARQVGLGEIAWRLPVSYAGGVLIGLGTAVVVLSVMIPFLAYLPAEELGISGVVSVVSCGLLMSQATPRVIGARTRAQAEGFWQLTTHILNGALFVLVGLQLWPVLTGTDIALGAALRDILLVTLVVVGTRLVWMNTVPYLVGALDRRPAQRLRWVGARQRFPVAWAGFRRAVSLPQPSRC